MQALGGAHFGRGTGVIVVDNLLCAGTESRLVDCPRRDDPALGESNCGHGEDMGAVCTAPKGSGGAPLLLGAFADGVGVTLAYDRPLDAAFAPGPADFAVSSDDGASVSRHAVTAVSVAGRRATLTVMPGIEPGVTVQASYVRPGAASARERGRQRGGRGVRGDRGGEPDGGGRYGAHGRVGETAGQARRAGGRPGGGGAGGPARRRRPGGTGAAGRLAARDRGPVGHRGAGGSGGTEPRGQRGGGPRPLSGLGRLRVLDLSDNGTAVLWPLAGLSGLERLVLADNRVADAAALAGLANLRVLDLSGNALGNVSVLGGLPRLGVPVGGRQPGLGSGSADGPGAPGAARPRRQRGDGRISAGGAGTVWCGCVCRATASRRWTGWAPDAAALDAGRRQPVGARGGGVAGGADPQGPAGRAVGGDGGGGHGIGGGKVFAGPPAACGGARRCPCRTASRERGSARRGIR